MAPLPKNALQLLEARYLLRNEQGVVVETPDQLFRRVAKAVALAELRYAGKQEADYWAAAFYSLLSNLLFLPNSPTLMNAGLPKGLLSACFVLPVEDSLDGIFSTLHLAAQVQKSGGGTGFNFSALRPRGDWIRGAGGASSGPLSFIKIFDTATEMIRQGGKRRGANMAILNVNHPDIAAFIQSKKAGGDLHNFNISVGITDAFMEALIRHDPWNLVHPRSGQIVSTLPAEKLWSDLVQAAWECGDPGLIFLDEIARSNPVPGLGEIIATNPCGEVPLQAYESCNLGSVNLARLVRRQGKQAEPDWARLEKIVRTAVRFLDNLIDCNYYLSEETRAAAVGNRKMGLGVMGWADLLIQLGVPYASEQAIDLAEELMRAIRHWSLEASLQLAAERGLFPNWEKSRHYPGLRCRNATLNSIAPTGSISIIAHASSSIEPLFSLAFCRRNILGRKAGFAPEINPYFVAYLKAHHLYSPSLIDSVLETGHLDPVFQLPDPVRHLFQTALEIPYSFHLRHQQAFQKYTDNAVSKTINLPADAKPETVDAAFQLAWRMHLKGVTVYRYGSKDQQVLYEGIRSLPADGQQYTDVCKVCG